MTTERTLEMFLKPQRWFCSRLASLSCVFFRSSAVLAYDKKVRMAILTIADQAICSATNFITSIIVAKRCSQNEFVYYVLGFSIFLFLIGTGNSLVTTPYIVYSRRQNRATCHIYQMSTLIQQLAQSFIASVFLIFLAVILIVASPNSSLGTIVLTIAIVVAPVQLKEFARQVAFADMKAQNALVLDAITSIIQVSSIVLAAYIGLLSAFEPFF